MTEKLKLRRLNH